jgi:hypothetical protein
LLMNYAFACRPGSGFRDLGDNSHQLHAARSGNLPLEAAASLRQRNSCYNFEDF